MREPDGCSAVLDVGKTHTRLVLFDARGTRRWSQAWASSARTEGGRAVLDVEGVWRGLGQALERCPERARIRRIIPTTHGAAGVLVRADGAWTAPLDYEAAIDPAIAQAYELQRPPFVVTGSPSLPSGLNLGRQLYAELTRDPRLRDPGTRLLTYPQFWAWRLSGRMASELTSLGCHTDLWDPHAGRASPLLEALGVPNLLPPLEPAAAELGHLRTDVAGELGLAEHVRVICGVHDSNAGLVPFRRSAEPLAVVSTGTWAVAMAPGSDAALDEARDMLLNVTVDGTPVPTARAMLGREHAMLTARASEGAHGPCSVADLQAIIDAGTFALPGIVAGGPLPGGPGTVVGPVPRHALAWRALADLYASLMLAELLEIVAPTRVAVLHGPLAENPAIVGPLASLCGAPVQRTRVEFDTAYGAAALGPDGPWEMPPLERVAPWRLSGLDEYRCAWRRALESHRRT